MYFLLTLLAVSDASNQLLVETSSGPIIGEFSDGFRVFKGVPFAASTGGPNRWREPQEPTPWSNPRSCTSFGPICPQSPVTEWSPVTMSEDCLSLNIWTPSNVSLSSLQTLVFIYGGAFREGASSNPYHFGDYYANSTTEPTVLVTINYRLGALGFLNVKENGNVLIGGNFGILDQQMALRWVQRNIRAFGGDPNNVSIFGQSAGTQGYCT
jgi:para-nitrobenzyl esterase